MTCLGLPDVLFLSDIIPLAFSVYINIFVTDNFELIFAVLEFKSGCPFLLRASLI